MQCDESSSPSFNNYLFLPATPSMWKGEGDEEYVDITICILEECITKGTQNIALWNWPGKVW